MQRGLRPVLAGRHLARVRPLAVELGLPCRDFHLGDVGVVAMALHDVAAVLNCAGPFAHTAGPMVDACLRAGKHYLDITGECGVFESLAARDAEARAAGIMLLPGVGFDVVPSDCLAAHLKRRLPSATRLALAIRGLGRVSRGTALTAIEGLGRGGLVRRDGVLTPVPAAWQTRTIDLGRGPVRATTIPWGDVVTAYYSTGIANVEVYAVLPAVARWALLASRYLGWLLGSPPSQRLLKRLVRLRPLGPTAEERARGASLLWGEVADDEGRRAVSRLRGPEAYALTVQTALAAVARVLAGEAPAGFRTPSLAYGADFTLEIEGVVREDVEY